MRIAIVCIILLFISHFAIAEDKKPKSPFRVEGSIGMAHDYYSIESSGLSSIRARRPEHLSRFQLYTRFSKGKVSLPFEISFNTQSGIVSSTTEGYKEAYSIVSSWKSFDDVLRFVSNPVNRIGFSPQFGKFRFRLGTSNPYFSELTQGNISQFGAGLDYTGKRMFFSLGYGISQPGQAKDTLLGIAGTYRREQASFRFGLGKQEASFFAINVTGSNDFALSGLIPDSSQKAQQGIASSLQWKIQLGRVFFWENEAAFSLFNEDKNATAFNAADLGLPELPNEIKLTTGTRADIAGSTSIGLELGASRISAKALYVGAGYRSLAYPFMQADRMELTINPRLNLFKNNLVLSGSFGQRVNNLSGTKAVPMNQLIVQSNINIRFTNWFSLSGGYGNFGTRSGVLNDSFRIENIAQNFQIAPLFTWQRKKGIHNFLFSANKDEFQDLNILTGSIGNNQSEIFLISWNRNPSVGAFSYGLSYNRFKFSSAFAALNNESYQANLGARIFKRRLNLSSGIGRLINIADIKNSADKQWIMNLGLDYRSKSGFGFGIRWNNNNYVYGSARPDSRFNENTLRINTSWQF